MTEKGGHHSPEARAKISAALKGRIRSPEHCAKIAESKRGEKNPAKRPEVRAKIGEAHRGKHLSSEHCRKIGEAVKGRIRSPEHCAKIAESKMGEKAPWYGKHLSPETRVKMSVAQSGENHYNWHGGLSFEPYCQKFNKEFKERVRAWWGCKCVLCGKSQAENGKKLGVHHVNYRKDACCNEEAPRYFVPLCMSCHSKTNHNREKWEEKLASIIERKYGGKCYFHKEEVLTAWGVMAS